MSDSSDDRHAPPPALARRGLRSVSDNVPPGMAVGNFARDFALIFRDELVNKFVLGKPNPPTQEAPCKRTAETTDSGDSDSPV